MGVLEKRRRAFVSTMVLCLFLVCVAGCGGGSPSSPALKTKADGAEKKAAQTKVPDIKENPGGQAVEYSYNAAGKPDPFKPFIQMASVREARNAPLTPLQKYEISQLRLVAIISGPQGNIALIEDAAGKGYFLKQGTDIGKNDGKVTRILKDKIIVEETYQDIFGQVKTNEIPLFLHRLEEGGES